METRVAKVWRIYPADTRTGGTRFETFFTAVDGSSPKEFAATTFEPFTAAFLEDARRDDQALWVTVDMGSYGFDLVRCARAQYD